MPSFDSRNFGDFGYDFGRFLGLNGLTFFSKILNLGVAAAGSWEPLGAGSQDADAGVHLLCPDGFRDVWKPNDAEGADRRSFEQPQ